MAEKALFTVGVFAGILDKITGKILLRRRIEEGSIIPNQSFKGNWELPGGGVMDQEKIPYAHLARELEREVLEETGGPISLKPVPFFFPVSFKGPKGCDLGLVAPITIDCPWQLLKEGLVWVSTDELNQLAKDFVAPQKDPP